MDRAKVGRIRNLLTARTFIRTDAALPESISKQARTWQGSIGTRDLPTGPQTTP